ncbi:MAG: hypothetical protein [Caudoviricetes sp.]|nr:MAG: hypothetical protein [Caudoviricetes sp.]
MDEFTVEIDGYLAEDIIADNAKDAAWEYCLSDQIYDQLIKNRRDEDVTVLDEDEDVTVFRVEIFGDGIRITEL